jgi:hypothetical protein
MFGWMVLFGRACGFKQEKSSSHVIYLQYRPQMGSAKLTNVIMVM